MHKLHASLGSPGARWSGADARSILAVVLGVVVFGMCAGMLLLIYLPVR